MDPVIRKIARVQAVPTLATGDVVADTYELGERLGAGGMGTVYRARDHRLGRAVAVKILKAGSGAAAEHARRLFEREARATAQLLHPNIVTLHHVGEQSGCPSLVLELLAGETLAARLARRGKLPIADGLAILDSVLAALAFAHDHGVVHRDLKPNNVFVTIDDRVKVLDFGLALELDTDPGPATRAAGTPGYMAPEQRDGGVQDARTDVWAAGLLLVECLTGRRCDDAEAADAIHTLDVPGPVRAQLAAALAADPEHRPSTAGELRTALARARAKLAPTPVRKSPWPRLVAFGIASAALGVAGTLAWRTVTREQVPPSPTPAEISGAWEVNFGQLALHVGDDGETYGVYEHDTGILVGHYRDGLFVGRWCELPTRHGSEDAGVIQLQFTRGKQGLAVDGRWAYGDSPDTVTAYSAVSTTQWHTGQAGFFGDKLDTPPERTLGERLDQHALCP